MVCTALAVWQEKARGYTPVTIEIKLQRCSLVLFVGTCKQNDPNPSLSY